MSVDGGSLAPGDDPSSGDAGKQVSKAGDSTLERWAILSWRLIVLGAAAVGGLWLVWRLRFVLIPIFVALLITVVLEPIARRLRRLGLPPLVATWLSFTAFLGSLALLGLLIVLGFRGEFSDLGPTITQGVDDIERWLIEGPLELDPGEVDRFRQEAADGLTSTMRAEALGGVILATSFVAGAVLSLVLAFLILKDGPQLQRYALQLVPQARHETMRQAAAAAWRTLGGFVIGAATLGAVEAILIGGALSVVGAGVVLPMMLLTFVAAFVPFVGAIVAGALAVLVALVEAGPAQAGIVAVVAIVVQQLDNELLAPWIYGKAVRLHPIVVLLAVATGTTIAGLMGTFLAVPVIATSVAAYSELRSAPMRN